MTEVAEYCAEMIRYGLRAAIHRPASASEIPANEDAALRRLGAAAAAVKQANGGKLLVAAYGSLPRKPEQGLVRPRRAVIPGFRKSLCVAVRTHRGTPERPGLVAGITPARREAAMALALEAEPMIEAELLVRLAQRELIGKAYYPKPLTVRLDDGRERVALGFAAALGHPDVRELSIRATARIVARARGCSGTNAEYLRLTLEFERAFFGSATPCLARIQAVLDCLGSGEACNVRTAESNCLGHFATSVAAA